MTAAQNVETAEVPLPKTPEGLSIRFDSKARVFRLECVAHAYCRHTGGLHFMSDSADDVTERIIPIFAAHAAEMPVLEEADRQMYAELGMELPWANS